jgi:hypothetical protein
MLQLRGIVTTHRHSWWCRKFDHGSIPPPSDHTHTHTLLPRPHAPFFPSIFFLFFPPGPTTPTQPRNSKHPHAATTEPFDTRSIRTTRAAPPHTTQPHPPLPSLSYQTRTRQKQRLKPTPRFTPRSTLHTASQRARGRWLQPQPHPRPRPTPPSIPTSHDPSRNKEHRRRRRPPGALC